MSQNALGIVNVEPLGGGRFRVISPDSDTVYLVTMQADRRLACACRAGTMHKACKHVAAVQMYVTGIERPPIEIPDALDVAQMHEEEVSRYLMRLNIAHRQATVAINDARGVRRLAIMHWHRAKIERKIAEKNKNTPQELLNTIYERYLEAEERRLESIDDFEIIAAQLRDIEGARSIGQSVLRSLRP